MDIVAQAFQWVLGLQGFVLLPLILLILSLAFGMKPHAALRAVLTVGVGFVGIFLVFDFFVAQIGPAVKAIALRTGIDRTVLDLGWPPFAKATWAFPMAPLLILLVMGLNMLLLALRATRTVNIDVWNYWHFIFGAALVYQATGSEWLAAGAALLLSLVMVKLCDLSASRFEALSGLDGIGCTTASGLVYYPLGRATDRIVGRVPGLRRISGSPERLKERLGLLGEPMAIGFVIGLGLGLAAGFEVRALAAFAVSIAAVMHVLPIMAGILGQGLLSISGAIKDFTLRRLPRFGKLYIGIDLAVLTSKPAVVVTGVLLMPVGIALGLLLPGVKVIPIGDLGGVVGTVSIVVAATGGNMFRAFLAGVPMMALALYVSTAMAGANTAFLAAARAMPAGYDGQVTSVLDGGNWMRALLAWASAGDPWAIAVIGAIGAGLLAWAIVRRKRGRRSPPIAQTAQIDKNG